ncbi:MAG: T9SS type A sorting domain-containing protein [bacterium]|nr:T9SS type A sorting domain-containing protein [bacterium]
MVYTVLFLLLFFLNAAISSTYPTVKFHEIQRQGGPDAYGYRFIDNVNEPNGPTYNWIEISGIAGGPGINTGLTLDDEVVSIPLQGFMFPFYGNTYANTISICSNGFIGFGTISNTFSNSNLPASIFSNPMIFAFWDDLYLPESGSVWYYYDVNNSRMIVEWYQVAHQVARLNRFTFQIQLYSNGEILFVYHTVQNPANSTTIGIQGPNGGSNNQYLTYTFNGNPSVPTSQLAIRFYRNFGSAQITIQNHLSQPVSNGLVVFQSPTVQFQLTNSNGIAQFSLVSGNYPFFIVADNYQAMYGTLTVPVNNQLDTIITLQPQIIVPSAPQNVQIQYAVNGNCKLAWQRHTTPTNFLGYAIYRINEMNDTSLIQIRVNRLDTVASDINLVNGYRYLYNVRVITHDGYSSYSSTISTTPYTIQNYQISLAPFTWNEISQVGTTLNLFGNNMVSENLYFNFPFFQSNYSFFQVTTSGYISFSPIQYSQIGYQSLLTPSQPNNILAAAWHDWTIPRDSVKYYYDSINQRFIITFNKAVERDNPNRWISFQYILNENGVIQLNYRNVNNPPQFALGVENLDGSRRSFLLPIDIPNTNQFSFQLIPTFYNGSIQGTFTSSLGEIIGGQVELVNFGVFDIPFNSNQYSIRNIPTGQYQIIARSEGYQSVTQVVNILPDSTLILNFQLTSLGNLSPMIVSVDTLFDDRVSLRWSFSNIDEVDTRVGFNIYRNNTLVATVPSHQFVYTDSIGSQFENIYFSYQISALYSTPPTESILSSPVSIRFNMKPAPPESLRVTTGAVSNYLTWVAPNKNVDQTPLTDLQGFFVYRDTTLIATLPATVTNFIDPVSDTTYFYEYKVIAFDDAATQPNRSYASNAVRVNILGDWRVDNFYWFSLNSAPSLPLFQDNVVRVPIGFRFPFYGVWYDSVSITSNGFLTFTSNLPYPTEPISFPSIQMPQAIIAPMWDDLNCTNGSVKIGSFEDLFVVSYENVRYQASNQIAGSFQVWLYPNGEIYFSYLDAPSEVAYGIGVEDHLGINGVELYINGNGNFIPSDSSAVRIWGLARTNGNFVGILRRRDGTPISNAVISCNNNWSTTSNQTGNWSLTVPSGIWNIEIVSNCLYPSPLRHLRSQVLPNQTISFLDTLYTPAISVNPTSITQTVGSDTLVISMQISNIGEVPLEWRSAIRYLPMDTLLYLPPSELPSEFHSIVDPPKDHSETFIETPSQTIDQFWGPDGYGYISFDRDDFRFPRWIQYRNIRESTNLKLRGDDVALKLSMNGCSFRFYGNVYDSIRINTNGMIQFVSDNNSYGVRYNYSLPTVNAINSILPLWDDLETEVYTYFETQDSIYFIEWYGNRYPNQQDTVHFQVQLHCSQSAILILYRTIRENSLSPTIGIQGGTGTNAYYLQNYFSSSTGIGIPTQMDNYGIAFIHPTSGAFQNWISLQPTQGVLQPNQIQTALVRFTFDTTIIRPNQLSANIYIFTNTCANATSHVTIDLQTNYTHLINNNIPNCWRLHPVYPNPFNSGTTICIDIPHSCKIRLQVVNILGRVVSEIYSGPIEAGSHFIRWKNEQLPSGMYFLELNADSYSEIQKIVVLR